MIAYLAEQRIPLKVCPSGNLCLGVCPDLAAHPLHRVREAGMIEVIKSGHPPLFEMQTLEVEHLGQR